MSCAFAIIVPSEKTRHLVALSIRAELLPANGMDADSSQTEYSCAGRSELNPFLKKDSNGSPTKRISCLCNNFVYFFINITKREMIRRSPLSAYNFRHFLKD